MTKNPTKSCLAVRHVAFEDLGLLGPLLADRGYDVRYHDAGIERFDVESFLAPDLVIVLGGPIGVYESETYPFIAGEVAAIGRRLDADRPMLGICLGAQMMAAALGARVAPGPVKEIGWAPLTLTDAGRKSVLAPLGATPVLHWHGDNCELPSGCERLAFTPHCPVQAFLPRAVAARAAVSSGDRAGAIRELAGRPHRRARQGRHRSARPAHAGANPWAGDVRTRAQGAGGVARPCLLTSSLSSRRSSNRAAACSPTSRWRS